MNPVVKKVKVLAGGTFNVIHPGHVFFLEKARSLGNELVVVLAHDETVLVRKHLLFPAKERRKVLESLRMVDRVIIGDRKDFFAVVRNERPDVIALGYDQKIDSGELDGVLAGMKHRCRIVHIGSKFKDYETKRLLRKLK